MCLLVKPCNFKLVEGIMNHLPPYPCISACWFKIVNLKRPGMMASWVATCGGKVLIGTTYIDNIPITPCKGIHAVVNKLD